MADNSTDGQIRPLERGDIPTARIFAARSVLEQLATANSKAYFSPWIIAAWAALGAVMVAALGYWPTGDFVGIWVYIAYLRPAAAYAVAAFPIMLAIDWQQRWAFEDASTARVKQSDMADPVAFYSAARGSGAFVMQWAGRPIALVTIDASQPDLKRTAAEKATVSLVYVDTPYRIPRAHVQDDLVAHAVAHAFNTNNKLQTIRARVCPGLSAYVHSALRNAGFRSCADAPKEPSLGLLRWPQVWLELTRDQWREWVAVSREAKELRK